MQNDVYDKLAVLARVREEGVNISLCGQLCASQVSAVPNPGFLCNQHEVTGSALLDLSGTTRVSRQNLMDDGHLAKTMCFPVPVPLLVCEE